MSARILSRDEVAALHDAGGSWTCEGFPPSVGVYVVDANDDVLVEVDGVGTTAADDERCGHLMAAAPDLRATALDAMDRADAAERMAAMSSEAAVSSAREFALIIAAQTARADAADAEGDAR